MSSGQKWFIVVHEGPRRHFPLKTDTQQTGYLTEVGFDMLLGSYSAKIDEKSRLRLPAKFRRDMPGADANSYYVTSDDGQCAQIYPLPVWERIAQKLQEPPRMDPSKLKLQRFTSYYGLLTQMDPQGRILIPQSLREDAQISGDVIVIGKTDHLEVWNNEVFRKSLMENPLTLEEREKLAEQGF